MNDAQIRSSFHRKKLRRHHVAPDTLVLDELGLKHGRFRADIAVINGHLIGYEIKSDDDSLRRLTTQIDAYNAVFDRATAVVGQCHLAQVTKLAPSWWGIIVATDGQRGAVHFRTIRKAASNPSTDAFAVAQLLWRNEAEEELVKQGFSGRILAQKRSILYRELVSTLDGSELRRIEFGRLPSRGRSDRRAGPSRRSLSERGPRSGNRCRSSRSTWDRRPGERNAPGLRGHHVLIPAEAIEPPGLQIRGNGRLQPSLHAVAVLLTPDVFVL